MSRRRRQGKSYLLQALAAARGGSYLPALELTEAVCCAPGEARMQA